MLIKCPECGKEISDKSELCINCGYPIKKESSSTKSLKYEFYIFVGDCSKRLSMIDMLIYNNKKFSLKINDKVINELHVFDMIHIKASNDLNVEICGDNQGTIGFARYVVNDSRKKFFDSELAYPPIHIIGLSVTGIINKKLSINAGFTYCDGTSFISILGKETVDKANYDMNLKLRQGYNQFGGGRIIEYSDMEDNVDGK